VGVPYSNSFGCIIRTGGDDDLLIVVVIYVFDMIKMRTLT